MYITAAKIGSARKRFVTTRSIFVRDGKLFTSLVLGVAALDNGRNIHISFICDNTFGIIIHLIFQFTDLSRYIRCRCHLSLDLVISLQKLDCEKSLLFFRNAVTQSVFYFCDNSFYIGLEFVNRCRDLLILSNLYSLFCCFFDSCSFQSGNLNNFTSK